MRRNTVFELAKHQWLSARLVIPAAMCPSRAGRATSSPKAAWSHVFGSCSMRYAKMAISRSDAAVARAYHSPLFHAVMRIAGRSRPCGPIDGSSSCSIQPYAEPSSHLRSAPTAQNTPPIRTMRPMPSEPTGAAAHPSVVPSMSASRWR